MDDHDLSLTPEDERLRQFFADEDSGKIPVEDLTDSLPPYVPLPFRSG